jgi:hypothetical protein
LHTAFSPCLALRHIIQIGAVFCVNINWKKNNDGFVLAKGHWVKRATVLIRSDRAGLPDFYWYNIPKQKKYTKIYPNCHKIYQYCHKIYRKVIKYTNMAVK